jgi:hypothetical protein
LQVGAELDAGLGFAGEPLVGRVACASAKVSAECAGSDEPKSAAGGECSCFPALPMAAAFADSSIACRWRQAHVFIRRRIGGDESVAESNVCHKSRRFLASVLMALLCVILQGSQQQYFQTN